MAEDDSLEYAVGDHFGDMLQSLWRSWKTSGITSGAMFGLISEEFRVYVGHASEPCLGKCEAHSGEMLGSLGESARSVCGGGIRWLFPETRWALTPP